MKSPTPQQIKDLRDKYSLTQKQLSEMIYVHLRTIQKYEKGDQLMPPAFWELLLIKAGDLS